MPVWHEATKQWVEDGQLVLLGLIQEQHADRCQLFAQWKGFDWPILHDPINVMESEAVPLFVAIDEHGIVRGTGPTVQDFESEFLNKEFDDDAPEPITPAPGVPNLDDLRKAATSENTLLAWRALGDGLILWGTDDNLNEAIQAYQHAVELDPEDGDARFRLGVALRRRYESSYRSDGDFQQAVQRWGEALAIDPNQYIWRRRIQQYGPRLIKPYPFYDWVDQAIAEIKQRGEKPVSLVIKPYGAELASPTRRFESHPSQEAVPEPDPGGRIYRDERRLIATEAAVVPATIAPGESARVHVTFRPSDELKAHWNNESEPLRLWVGTPEDWEISAKLLEAPQGLMPETQEVRRIDFEIQTPQNTPTGTITIPSYALYYVCEDVGGVCLYLRQDIEIPIVLRAED